jgi:hypothetical protein
MNAIVPQESRALSHSQAAGRMAVAEIISHVATVQEVMRAVMKPDVHYGKIPGAGDKPTLFKAGAEVLCMVFRIADTYEVTDLSTSDCIRYRVNCIGTHQTTGIVMGAGLGEASSNEEKYKWRKVVCHEEWEETPANLRRVKHARGKGGTTYKQEQVRTEPADIANTVLKMANKRAKMAMVLNVTAASDCFAQDLEDMDEALREHLARKGDESGAHAEHPEQPAGPPTWPDDVFAKQLPKFRKAIEGGKTADEIIAWAGTKGKLTEAQLAAIRAPQQPASAAPTYADVAHAITHAADRVALSAAEKLIEAIPDAQQRDELIVMAERRDEELPTF